MNIASKMEVQGIQRERMYPIRTKSGLVWVKHSLAYWAAGQITHLRIMQLISGNGGLHSTALVLIVRIFHWMFRRTPVRKELRVHNPTISQKSMMELKGLGVYQRYEIDVRIENMLLGA